jgi:hypothetical protein
LHAFGHNGTVHPHATHPDREGLMFWYIVSFALGALSMLAALLVIDLRHERRNGLRGFY